MDGAVAALLGAGHGVVEYHGRVSDEDKSSALKQFREDSGVKALVGHAQSGGRGLDMSAADWIIWYSHTFNARTRRQAAERATEMCGSNVTMVDFVVRGGPDRYIRDTVDSRGNVEDDLAGRGLRDVLEEMGR